jgi:hypothetical protein
MRVGGGAPDAAWLGRRPAASASASGVLDMHDLSLPDVKEALLDTSEGEHHSSLRLRTPCQTDVLLCECPHLGSPAAV